ncbi:hypothetical protein PRIPAC_77047 [Pristionchus pacificus]|uniref:Uncharacterized protein n=1 Tax=Pristionchus pacificus TaxID=54126 RepID=A0A454Y1Q6_PRIPA|nr:hypothetical protein PRIPAC_77047 [Pristionchus pacificus]|eukprot:PDM65504.1 hypothetical protein PRIPAC_52446 [Pristionchus pacificus]
MFRSVLAVVALAAVALADDQADFAALRGKIQSALASFDPAFVQKIQELGKNLDLSRNQKIAQIKEAVAALPADQQEKAQKFMDFGLQKEQEMITLAKSLIPDFSADTQAVLNNIVSAYENGADTPTKTLVEQIKTIINGASDAVKAELKAAKSGLVDKVKDFAKSMIPAN